MTPPLVSALLLVVATAAAADEARVAMSTALAARVEAGTHSGLVVTMETQGPHALVTVSQSLRPFATPPSLPLAAVGTSGDATALEQPVALVFPAELETVGARGGNALDVVAAVVSFVSRRITLDEADPGPQDAMSVLRRGRGRCSGRANLAIGWLRSLGIPARAVHGVLLADAGPRWHRWGEAWLGGLGWVPFDPGASVGVVSVRYVPMRGAGEGALLSGVTMLRIDERGYAALPRRGALRTLPVGGASLRCVATAPDATISALLQAPDGTRWARSGAGEVLFAELLPGRYLLRWTPHRGGVGQMALRLDGPREVRIGEEVQR